jgi:hypothetical protein
LYIKLNAVRAPISQRQQLAGVDTLADVILYWPQSSDEITVHLKELRTAIVPNGGIWGITAKKGHKSTSGMA